MNPKIKKWFWALVIAQAVFLLGWAGYHEYVRQKAPVLLLKARPVDPQDLLRGDYMIMRYDISVAALPAAANHGREVWVLLAKKDKYHEIVSVSLEQPAVAPGQVLVRGDVGYAWAGGRQSSEVNYGIEKYFVPEGQGRPHFKLMEAEVSVSPAHRLYLKRVLLDGTPFP